MTLNVLFLCVYSLLWQNGEIIWTSSGLLQFLNLKGVICGWEVNCIRVLLSNHLSNMYVGICNMYAFAYTYPYMFLLAEFFLSVYYKISVKIAKSWQKCLTFRKMKNYENFGINMHICTYVFEYCTKVVKTNIQRQNSWQRSNICVTHYKSLKTKISTFCLK